MNKVYNFCAGPAMLPEAVMRQAQEEFINWQGHGSSVMELSHRSEAFIEVANQAEQDARDLLQIPDNYKVLFTHGGGRGQFSAVPLNLTHSGDTADFLVSGAWSKGAVEEAKRYLTPNVVAQNVVEDGITRTARPDEWHRSDNAAYFHYCPNETVDGIAIDEIPKVGDVPVIADMSSTIMSRPLDVAKFGVIYAGAQKNIGPSGLSLVIVRDDLLDQARQDTPSIFHYKTLAEHDSMYNTPPTFAWYLAGLVFKWLKSEGGLSAMAERNQQKAGLLYGFIDNSDFYRNQVAHQNRSLMNVPFQLADSALDNAFLLQAEARGLTALKGHRSVGGMRASIYNAMPLEGVEALVSFMQDFEKENG